jgi:RNA polymerase sigma-70 factor (ECF subfamily)
MTLAFAPKLDTDLIARIRAGDERAFEQLFHRYYRELCVYAARVDRSPGAAEEIVQEVFFRVWRRREQLLLVQTLSSYLYAAVRNVALNRLARAHTEDRWRASKRSEQLDVPIAAPPPDEEIRATEMAVAIDQAVSALPPRCREAFLLRRQQQLSYAEIAQVMHTSPKTVEIQIGKALQLLRKSLAEWL